MMFRVPFILITFITFVVWTLHGIKRASAEQALSKKKFQDKELQANSTRKKSLDNLDYITIPLKTLPFIQINDEIICSCQEKITELAEKKIVNFTGITNTDLKLEYGAPNITALTQYDENFTSLVHNLFKWARRLHELEKTGEAIVVLEYGVKCRTDVSGHYKLLGDIYAKMGRTEEIDRLIEIVQTLNTLTKKSMMEYLEELKGRP